LGELE
jgi:hypothetical protein